MIQVLWQKNFWGGRSTSTTSTWVQRKDEAVKGTLSWRTQYDTTLPGLDVQGNLVKDCVSSDRNTSDGHCILQNKHVHETALKPSKRNENNTIKWCPKNSVRTQTLERLNVSTQCQERTSIELPQKIV